MKRTSSILALAFVAALAAGQAAAMSSGSSSTATTAEPGVEAYNEAKKLVKVNNWKGAIKKLQESLSENPNSADANNLLGYSYRKTKDYDNAFKYYEAALALDPGHADAHEYIGEAYLETDNLAKAEEHLASLQQICPSGCEQLEELTDKVEEYKAKHGTGS
jgi:tetratricopeptide (TPR) repeat protein